MSPTTESSRKRYYRSIRAATNMVRSIKVAGHSCIKNSTNVLGICVTGVTWEEEDGRCQTQVGVGRNPVQAYTKIVLEQIRQRLPHTLPKRSVNRQIKSLNCLTGEQSVSSTQTARPPYLTKYRELVHSAVETSNFLWEPSANRSTCNDDLIST